MLKNNMTQLRGLRMTVCHRLSPNGHTVLLFGYASVAIRSSGQLGCLRLGEEEELFLPIPGQNSVNGAVHVPADGLKEWRQEPNAELFFFVPAGKEDPATKVKAVNQPFDSIGRGSHGSEEYVRGTSSQGAADDVRARR